ncbi:MAG: cupin domain-containing protein [Mahellales bacterium]|jgi:mannose-6-phosphate isomerase-like protein (cupin superfamily)
MRNVIHEDEVRAVSLPGREHKMIIGPGLFGNARNMSFGVAKFPPLSHAPSHVHEEAEEIIYFLQGSGQMYFDGQPQRVEPGCCVYVPKKVRHSIKNDSDRPMKLCYVFSPPVKQGSYEEKKEK